VVGPSDGARLLNKSEASVSVGLGGRMTDARRRSDRVRAIAGRGARATRTYDTRGTEAGVTCDGGGLYDRIALRSRGAC